MEHGSSALSILPDKTPIMDKSQIEELKVKDFKGKR